MRPLPPDHLPFLILHLEVLDLSFVIREIYIYIFAGSKVAFWEYFPLPSPLSLNNWSVCGSFRPPGCSVALRAHREQWSGTQSPRKRLINLHPFPFSMPAECQTSLYLECAWANHGRYQEVYFLFFYICFSKHANRHHHHHHHPERDVAGVGVAVVITVDHSTFSVSTYNVFNMPSLQRDDEESKENN